MTPEQVLQQLADNQSTEFPEAAIREVMANPAPHMEALLAEMAKPAAQLREEGYRFINLAGYLTAYHRETRAYPLLIQLLRADYDDVDYLFNDALIDDVSRMLASICGDELAPLVELIKDQTLDEYVRNSGLQALQILYHVGRLRGEDFHALITELVQDNHMAGLETLTTVAIVEEGLSSLTPVVEEWFREGKIEPMFFGSFNEFTGMLNQPFESSTALGLVDDPIAMAQRSPNLGGLTNDSAKAPAMAKAMISPETGSTARSTSKPVATLAHDAAADGAYVRTQAKVGRNDPCPCGSGKKFKKCCGK